jgi:myosin heavy subunit
MGCDIDDGGIEGNEHLKQAALLLGVDPTALFRALSEKVLGSVGRRTSIQVQYLDKMKASANRDALSREIYSRLFAWLLRATNRAIASKVDNDSTKGLSAKLLKEKMKAQRSISVLDIFGFEIFQVNGFEQLLINYANEVMLAFMCCVFYISN